MFPWFQEALDRFDALHAAERLPHAMLVEGPEGWGVDALGDLLAVRLLDLEARSSEQRLEDVAHPDLRVILPDGNVIKVDAIRALNDFAVGTPQRASAKVGVIHNAHCLNVQSANALLKSLEEPASDTYLLLITEYPWRLLPTIRSRCQRLTLAENSALATQWLQHRPGGAVPDPRLGFEFRHAPLAVSAAQDAELEPLAPALERALQSGDVGPLCRQLSAAAPEEVLIRWLRYLVAASAGLPEVPAVLSAIAPERVHAFAQELIDIHRAVLSSNSVNTGLQFERLAHRFRALRDLV
ncbi:MAG: hypothetical protein AAF648_02355 [Pseudomonadota bacterium]